MSAHPPATASGKPTLAAARAPADVLRVVLAYAVFASLWILLSDTVVGWLFSDPAQIVRVSTIKGWLFVVVTSLLLYGLIRRLRDQALAGARQELAAQAEKARALQLLAAIADNSSDAIFAKDREGRYLLANHSAERIVGKTAEQMLGQDDTFLFPQQAAAIRANDRRVMDENCTNIYEETVATAEGERTFLGTKGPLHDEQGRVTGMFGISRDITERNQTERALRESEAPYHSLFDNSHAVMLLIDPDGGTIVAANPAAAAYYGWTLEQLQGMRIDQINALSPAEVAAEMRLAQTRQRNGFEFRHRLADGQVRDVEVFSGPVQVGGRSLLYSIVNDISARKQAVLQLAESKARFEVAMQASQDGLWEWNVLTDEEYFAARWYEILGYAREDPSLPAPTFKSWEERIHPDDHERVMSALASHLEKRTPYSVEYRHRHRSGEYRWQHSRGLAVFDENGKPTKMVGTISDITERKHAELALARLDRLYATLSQSNQAIVRCDSEDALFPQICRDAVSFGGLKMAWIGLVDESGHQVKPFAAFGDDDNYLADIHISMDADDPHGQGPTATAISENRPVWCQNFLHDPRTASWHERAARAGWAASAALPLCRQGVAVGALNLYAGEADFFDDAIQKLLTEMAADISFAMDSYAATAERKRAKVKMAEQLEELRRWQQATLGREGRILSVKKEINDLLVAQGLPPRYPSALDEGAQK